MKENRMEIHFKGLIGLVAVTLSLVGCDRCDGHPESDTWCAGNRVVQCQQGTAILQYSCGSDGCADVPGKNPVCLLPGVTCPTANLGYQCMGQRRIECLADGRVGNYGLCPPPSDAGGALSYGPYCVENPGGPALNCGWEPQRCDVEGEVRCFADGSAICRGNIYLYFRSNAEAGQLVCDVTQMNGCWNGKTWCEGDVLKRCDRCLDGSRCSKVSTQSVCSPGACVRYAPPAWLADAYQQTREGKPPPMGCAVDLPECGGATGMVCTDGTPALCASVGKAVIALSCADIESVMGTYVPSNGSPATISYGPYCVPRSGGSDVPCVLDTAPCETGRYRCDPTDSAGKTIQYCEGGFWMKRSSCEYPGGNPPTTICSSTASSAFCQ